MPLPMTDSDKQREDEWAKHKWECLVRYVARLNKADQIQWASKQSETTKELVRNEILQQSQRNRTPRSEQHD